MPSYKAPVADTQFVLNDVIRIADYAHLPGFVCREQWTATPVKLPQSYVDAAVQAVPVQLAKAGARIAAMLNKALDPNPYNEDPPPWAPVVK